MFAPAKVDATVVPDDTASPTPVRYQQYGITLKLNPNKDDMLNRTYNSKGLAKTLPHLWVCCANYGCNAVYDVSNANDTQRNVHLGKMTKDNTVSVMQNMTVDRLS